MAREGTLKQWVCIVVLAAVGFATPPVQAEGQATQQATTMQGVVVDPAAYLKGSQQEPELADKIYEAVDGGQTLALLNEDDLLYLFLAEEPGEDPNELAYDHVGQRVKVTGHVYERGGMRGIVATAVEPLTPEGAAQNTPPSAPAE